MAEQILGKLVIIGITRSGRGGGPDTYEQMWGVVADAQRVRGVLVELMGVRAGEEYWLPPQPSAFSPAEPGLYRLKSTGEEVEDPDYITTWTIEPPADA